MTERRHPLDGWSITSVMLDDRETNYPWPIDASHPMFDPKRQDVDLAAAFQTLVGEDDLKTFAATSAGALMGDPEAVRTVQRKSAELHVNWPPPGDSYWGIRGGSRRRILIRMRRKPGAVVTVVPAANAWFTAFPSDESPGPANCPPLFAPTRRSMVGGYPHEQLRMLLDGDTVDLDLRPSQHAGLAKHLDRLALQPVPIPQEIP